MSHPRSLGCSVTLEPALGLLEGAGGAGLIYRPLCPSKAIAGVARTEGRERSALVLALGEISGLSRRMSAPLRTKFSVSDSADCSSVLRYVTLRRTRPNARVIARIPIMLGQQGGTHRKMGAVATVELGLGYPPLPVAWWEHRLGRPQKLRE